MVGTAAEPDGGPMNRGWYVAGYLQALAWSALGAAGVVSAVAVDPFFAIGSFMAGCFVGAIVVTLADAGWWR